MASIQTYILICNGCTAPFIPLDAERISAPRLVGDVRQAAKDQGWSEQFIAPKPGAGAAGRTEDFCAACTRDAQVAP